MVVYVCGLDSALQRLALIALLLLQLLVFLAEILSNFSIAESTASGVNALLALLLIVPALLCCECVSGDQIGLFEKRLTLRLTARP